MRIRTMLRSSSAVFVLPIVSVMAGRAQKASLRTSTSHASPLAGSVTMIRPDSGSVSICRTLQPRSVRPALTVRMISSMEAGFSVATSRS